MKLRKSNLDEQQERKLLEIESRGCWLAFWGLLLALIVESLVIKDSRAVIGEWVLFMALSLYLVISCSRAGIWDRRLDMSRKTCAYSSLIAGACVAVFTFGFISIRSHRPLASLYAAVITGLFAFVACYCLLRLMARVTKKRQDELNAEPDDDFDEEEAQTHPGSSTGGKLVKQDRPR